MNGLLLIITLSFGPDIASNNESALVRWPLREQGYLRWIWEEKRLEKALEKTTRLRHLRKA